MASSASAVHSILAEVLVGTVNSLMTLVTIFAVYALLCLVTIAFVRTFVPETKRQLLERIAIRLLTP